MSASCSALRRLTHRSPRTFQSRISSVSRISSATSSFSSLNALRAVNSTAPRVSRFSTMAPLQSGSQDGALQKPYDPEIQDMANYIHNYEVNSDLAYDTARLVFLDTLGCGLEALKFKECTKLLGPVVEGTVVPNGTRVPGTPYQLDPVNGAFNIGAMIRWLDYNDCWLAAEWGHPSDNLGGILAVADWISRTNRAGGNIAGGKIVKVKEVLEAMIKAHEIQGVLALENSYNKVGLDHVVLVKVATTAVVAKMLGLSEKQTADAISQAFVDGQSLRTYRHSPNTMSRKSWAAGDACQRAVNLVLKVQKGEGGLHTVLSAPVWGFYDVLFKGNKFKFQRPYGSYVMENVLFKVSYPAEFHSQTAIEAAEIINKKLAALGKSAKDIKEVTNRTHEACIRIIDKQFKAMDNFADRDHCVQYMVATMLAFNRLTATDYADGSEAATSPLVEDLRKRIRCVEDTQFTTDYHDPAKRTIPNALTVTLNDGTVLEEVVVEAPLGHRLRREEAKPEILAKYKRHLQAHFEQARIDELLDVGLNKSALEGYDVDKYVDLYVKDKMVASA
ncbi:MmgE/PrpD family-domain-containing protein [Aspergillus novoparasiticus]|uniref:MmgE/PrpD family-domain-containing protein n=3 Tax=Aspergillus subgen. Circumdati TaxID=2720871 RepID=A0A5N6IV60_9EURO|nr:MmgE/PrpD family-domain-containing protein [Aspergillus novoparasiticus]KAB8270245.1 MmgE/PrpD family-domain-containing protein [Aspergillus minisclerotigenes]KAE8323944.1 MmgE/PrpD family-domain-containing protein [Aspergillus sergii]